MFANEAVKPIKAQMTKKRREMMYANIDNANIYSLIHQLSQNMKKTEDSIFLQYLEKAGIQIFS